MLTVLTYHSTNISGNEYHNNDHVSLAADLGMLADAGIPVWPLAKLLDSAKNETDDPESAVAITFDDGAIFDYADFEHPLHGPQPSFFSILDHHRAVTGDEALTAASFVIASPDARNHLDRQDYGGHDWWHDRWWQPASESGLLSIENHSWDHNHPSLPETAQKDNETGNFFNIDSFEECERELAGASDYIESLCARPQYFAYPWGHASDYLAEDYLPNNARRLGLKAAFTATPGHVNSETNPWLVPRFVCGNHWSTPEEFMKIVRGAA